MVLSEKIKVLRKARGHSQEELGLSLSNNNENGISRQTISAWENGISEPKLNNIRDLAKFLDVPFDVLLDDNIDLGDKKVLEKVLNKSDSSKKEQYASKNNTQSTINNKMLLLILFVSIVLEVLGIVLELISNNGLYLFLIGIGIIVNIIFILFIKKK